MNPGRVRVRLATMLAELDIIADPSRLWCQEGAHRHCDGARWGGWAQWKNDSMFGVRLFSWDTMTDCVTHGIMIREQDYGRLEVEIYGKRN